MTKELVLLYFRNKSTFQEDRIVEEWLKSSPANTQQAMKWMDELSDEEEKLFLKVVLDGDDVWKKTIEEINLQSPENQDRQQDRTKSWIWTTYRHTHRYAAVLVSILMLAFAIYVYRIHSTVEVRTDFGKVTEVILPDGSSVILNGNSSLKYAYSWKEAPREVWLEGEAFFHVKRKADRSRFKVYLSDNKTIEVLGTEFNVSERALKSTIFLKSGKIMLHLADQTHQENIALKPGELVELEGDDVKLVVPKKVVNPEKYYGWTKNKWILDGTSLREMLVKLEENYDVHVDTENENMLDKRVSGSIPLSLNNADTLIADIANLFELKIIRENRKITLVTTE
ncbi:FecR family protein [Dyadobacter sp. NIV53]|uniref:FecR family protein n=1 Tax=Dyadobacter sp. NIV53 TaxID=2861765 RepID=UPI001C873EE9|nr:FecR family protein [Dyadobacter sp. NIV53]